VCAALGSLSLEPRGRGARHDGRSISTHRPLHQLMAPVLAEHSPSEHGFAQISQFATFTGPERCCRLAMEAKAKAS